MLIVAIEGSSTVYVTYPFVLSSAGVATTLFDNAPLLVSTTRPLVANLKSNAVTVVALDTPVFLPVAVIVYSPAFLVTTSPVASSNVAYNVSVPALYFPLPFLSANT